MTEAQKYEGSLYKEKPAKNQQKKKNEPKQDTNAKPNGNTHHRAPYVEDAPDVDDPKANMPVATPANNDNHINVFDFLDTNASKVSVAEPNGQMQMTDRAPSVFQTDKAQVNTDDVAYAQNGFSYGAGPVQPDQYPHQGNASMEFMTPAPKKKKDRSRKDRGQAGVVTSEKKRKRRAEDVDMDDVNGAQGIDTPMMDAPSSVQNHPGTPMLHTGLTGGLDRILRSPSVQGEEQVGEHSRRRYQEPVSPIKRTRRTNKEANSFEAGLKGRAGRFVSSMLGGSVMSGSSNHSSDMPPKALVRTRRRSSSDEGQQPTEARRSKKSHKVRNPSNSQVVPVESHKTKRKTSGQPDSTGWSSRRAKEDRDMERPRGGDDARDMVVYRQPNIPSDEQHEMAVNFLSLVTKGPESSRGFSVNKILKRFHKDTWGEYEDGSSRADREQRQETEKDLWRTLRLKRNERGEIVVIL